MRIPGKVFNDLGDKGLIGVLERRFVDDRPVGKGWRITAHLIKCPVIHHIGRCSLKRTVPDGIDDGIDHFTRIDKSLIS